MPEQLNEIMRALGRLEQGMERQRADFENEKESSRESRGRMYDKLEKIEGEITKVGAIAKDAQEKATEVAGIITNDVKPATDDFRRMRTIGFVGLSLLGFAFTALGITLATVGEGVVNTIRTWLRIH